MLERTREIGVRRAVGARRQDIRSQFIAEALAITMLGGVAGILVGTAIAGIVAASAGWPRPAWGRANDAVGRSLHRTPQPGGV